MLAKKLRTDKRPTLKIPLAKIKAYKTPLKASKKALDILTLAQTKTEQYPTRIHPKTKSS